MERIENKIEKRNNKKNVQKKVLMVAGLALLLGFVGYTGGTTYAKYVTSQDTGSQVATVAKWGYTISANATKLFGTRYEEGTGVVADDGKAVISVDGTTKVVAPGTNGTFKISVAGKAEVMSSLEINKLSEPSDISVKHGENYYYPVKWSVKVNENTIDSQTVDTIVDKTGLTTAQLVNYLDAIGDTSIAANSTVNLDLDISWAWAFVGTETLNGLTANELDTMLGNGTAPADYTLSTSMSFGISINVQQIEPNS